LMARNRNQADAEGEVVYRRLPPADQTPPRSRGESRIDPALLPLIVGFAILLILILLLGNLSVRRLEDTSRRALEMEQTHLARTTLLMKLRVALTQVDNEARDRMQSEARRELRPPFDLRLDTARNKFSVLLQEMDRSHLSEQPGWQHLRVALGQYLEITKDRSRYTQEGYTAFRDVDAELNKFIEDFNFEQGRILNEADRMQQSAARSIRIWNVIALLMALLVAAATIWQVQRRFSQTRRSTEAARREREFSNQILEGMVSAIAAIDRQDRIRSANAAFFQIFPETAIGASIHDGVATSDRTKLLEAATASHIEVATYRGRWALEQNGASRTFDVYSSPLEIDGEHGQILTLVDVTEAVKSEAALRRTESLTAVGSAAAQLAHEIKNPLGSIRLGVEMLRQYTTDPEADKTISLVERGIHHLNKLVVDVTQFSRPRQLEVAETDLHEVINSSVEMVEDRVRDKETPIKKSFDREAIRGMWDKEQLREVFVNLLANAIDASEAKSSVEVSTELIAANSAPRKFDAAATAQRDHAVITIADHGLGMDRKVQARLFEPFFTTKKRGTGLGLSIVRQIVDLHGGTIEVQSEKGQGTTFRIELPLQAGNGLAS
jgi:two-component system, NtrC family, nitrogen regulation sensor histidine kinase GlnL